MTVFSWEDITSGVFAKKLRDGGFCASAIATGGFDGLHRGHHAIIETLIREPPPEPLRSVIRQKRLWERRHIPATFQQSGLK